MNKYIKEFLHRGLIFSGLGPIVLGIVYAILEKTITDFFLTGPQICIAIISTYLLAFLQAGATVFNQIDSWPLTKSLLCHFITLYLAYVLCYLFNSWIPFVPEIIAIFTTIFIVGYFAIWLVVYLTIKTISRKMNKKLN